jgi:hypothetical protein
MPKRPSDTSPSNNLPPERLSKKTERSHEENQERAYIAASRRADRSIEARVQSARMASEIHRKRTGKGFKISEEIVMKEEMYEEEDDDLPRHYRALAAHLQTSSSEMNHRLSAYLSNQVAMASWARQQEVNRMFAEQFPNAGHVSQQLSNSMYFQPLQTQVTTPSQAGAPSPRSPPAFNPVKYEQSASAFPRTQDSSSSAALSPSSVPVKTQSPETEDDVSPPGLTPASHRTDTPKTNPTPTFFQGPSSFVPMNSSAQLSSIDPTLSNFAGTGESAFTSELSNEAKLMANIDMNDPLASVFFGGNSLPGDGLEMARFQEAPIDFATPQVIGKPAPPSSQPDDYFGGSTQASAKLLDLPGENSNIGTPGGGEGDAWDSWVNNDEWNSFEAAAR